MKTVRLLLTCIILLSSIVTFAANLQETPDPIPQEEQTTPKEGPTLQKAPEKPEEPTFNFPAIVFKGKKLKRQDIGTFDRIFMNGKEVWFLEITINNTGGFDIKIIDEITIESIGSVEVKIIKDNQTYTYSIYSINGILTLLPPLVAIILALIFKDVLIALFVGIFTGALFINRFDFITAFFNVVDKYVLEALADPDRASIIIFTLLLGGMVGIITKSGGVKGIVDSLSRKVKSTKGVQFYTWLMGILIFFDDYTNTLVVGNTMRPLTDRWKISREKLSYIVDSTAAPMACLAIISTWIGFEISLINQQLEALHVDLDAYSLFLSSIPYRFYPILAMIFVALIFTLRRDFGPMHKAEKRARKEGKLMKDNAVPLSDFESSGLSPAKFVKAKWFNGLIPIIVVIASTFIGLYISGKATLAAKGDILGQLSVFQVIFSTRVFKNLGTIITSANSFQVLLWASFLGVCTAMLMARIQNILKLKELITAFVQGLKSMMMAIIILVMAWSLGVVLGELNTADFLVSLIRGNIDYHWFPAIVFFFSCVIAFSTGTSWGTLAIMYPLVIPAVVALTITTPDFHQFLVMTIASVLAGAVFGDHCSPISDTTIMSSMASSCDHIDHVRTQIPYAVLMAVMAFVVGILPISFGFPYLLSLLAAIGLSLLILRFLGKKAEDSKPVGQ